MGFILLEGIDRTGKSTVAEYFSKQGFEVVHFNAPDKKYYKPGYTGPSYIDEILDLLIKYDGKDVVFDRTWYGEFTWPHVYNRKPLLTLEDIEIIEEYEQRNNTQKILMTDKDVEAHWQRCVDNKEPLNHNQFMDASVRYKKLVSEFGFTSTELGDFNGKLTGDKREDNTPIQKEETIQEGKSSADLPLDPVVHQSKTKSLPQKAETTSIQEKLEKANAINSILSKRIIKQKGMIFESIEEDIKLFLKNRLSEIMSADSKSTSIFSDDEVQMLKTLCQQWQSKLKG
jgi:hypothetical protein